MPDPPAARNRGGRPPGRPKGETRQRVLDLLRREHARSGVWLSREVVAERLGITPQAVNLHRLALIASRAIPAAAAERGRPQRVAGSQRGRPRLTLPLYGRSAAGPPALAELDPSPIDVADLLTGGRTDVWCVLVDGDSMEPAGIHPGDYAVIRPEDTADDGAIVLARVIDEQTGEARSTIKQLFHDTRGRVILHSANPTMPDLRPAQVDVIGIVIAVVRSLGR